MDSLLFLLEVTKTVKNQVSKLLLAEMIDHIMPISKCELKEGYDHA